MKTPQQININIHNSTHEQGERIIADALAECRNETVQECADVLVNKACYTGNVTALRDAILAVAEPPVPVWCDHLVRVDVDNNLFEWRLKSQFGTAETFMWYSSACPICGAPKPQVTT